MLKSTVDRVLTEVRHEHDLLLCCARVRMDPERADRIRALVAGTVDWAYLIGQAHPHGMVPLLYRHLRSIGGDRIPGAVMEQLKERSDRQARHALILVGELLRLLKLLEAHGIRAVPLKGPVLAEALYGDLSLRPFRDLDLLVRKQDVVNAKALFLSEGYRLPVQMNGAQEAAFLGSACDFLFERDAGRTLVELHWDVVPRYFSCRLDIESMWRRLEPVAFAGREVVGLGAEDLLLALCVHGAKHGWERLEWICDVAELVDRRREIEWAWVLDQAASAGAERMLRLGLKLASDLLGADVPKDVRRWIESAPAVDSLARWVRERLARGESGPLGIFESAFFHLRAKERLPDRVRYVFCLAVIPGKDDWRMLPLPTPLRPLYYLLRPIRLLRKYGWRGLKWLIESGRRWVTARLRPTPADLTGRPPARDPVRNL